MAITTSTYKGYCDSLKPEIDKNEPDWDFIKEWIKRCTAYVISEFKTSKATILALEDLSFAGMNYEKFMILLQEKILESQIHIKMQLVDPSCTSRTCWICGFEDIRNRPSQAEFLCLNCNFNENADVNAAKIITIRCAIDLAKEAKERGQDWKNRFHILESSRYNKILIENIEWANKEIQL